ncbi:MAG: hypothetical protein V3V11_06995 [Vicinamibacteria bacterium]
MLKTLVALAFASLSLIGAEASATPPESQDPDFLFGAPRFTAGFRAGWNLARAESDLFEFIRELQTIGDGDFDAPTLGADFALVLNQRLDVVFGFQYSRSSTTSEFREFVGSDDLPIVQQTNLTQFPLTASAKFYLVPRGQEVSRYAWVARGAAPYVGAGVGLQWYKFEQAGEFIDCTDPSLVECIDQPIFEATLVSSAWTPTVHVFGGVDVKLGRKMFLTVEGRYAWADAKVQGDFIGFDSIDLTGLGITAGVYWVFN